MKIKLRLDDVCDFCNKENETLYHLFYECEKVKTFWKDFQMYWKEKTNVDLQLPLKTVITGDILYKDITNY